MAANTGLQWVYPSNGHVCHEDRVLLVGSVPAGGKIALVGTTGHVEVSSQGNFSGWAHISGAQQTLSLKATLPNGQMAEQSRTIKRSAPKTITAVSWQTPQQGQVLRVTPGLVVSVQGTVPAGVAVSAQWVDAEGNPVASLAIHPGINTKSPSDVSSDQRHNVFGQLHQLSAPAHAATQVKALVPVPMQPVAALRLCWGDDTGSCGVGSQTFPVQYHATGWQGVITGKRPATMRSSPHTMAPRLTPQWADTVVPVLGTWGDWALMALSHTQKGWVPLDNITLIDDPLYAPLALPAFRIALPTAPDADTLALAIAGVAHAERQPIIWEVTPHGATLTLCHTPPECDVLPQPWLHNSDAQLYMAPTADGTGTVLTYTAPKGRQVCGMAVTPSGHNDWQWTLRHYPANPKDWRIVLDAGHGGGELGSIAPNGVPEKTQNLAVALACQQALAAAGFKHVSMIRTTDTFVGLAERQDAVAEKQPHICLSLHHNALPDGRDPGQHRGLSTFYYYPSARPLALHLAGALSSSLGLPQDKVYWDNLALTRIPDAASVLIEWGYFTNPHDADVVLAKDFANKAANALVAALIGFTP